MDGNTLKITYRVEIPEDMVEEFLIECRHLDVHPQEIKQTKVADDVS